MAKVGSRGPNKDYLEAVRSLEPRRLGVGYHKLIEEEQVESNGEHFRLTQTSFGQEIEDLRRALQWLNDLGIRTSGTRYASYLKSLIFIEARWRAGATRADEIPVDPLVMETAFVESSQLLRIWRGLHATATDGVVARLRKATKGPVLLKDEKATNSSNAGRDSAFELEIAAGCAHFGAIGLEGRVDVRSEIGTIPVSVECKRPSSERKLTSSLKEASTQLEMELSQTALACYGVVAMSVSKSHWKAGALIKGGSMESIRQSMVLWLKRFDERYVEPWFASVPDGRIIAVFVHLPYVAYVGDSPTIVGTELMVLTRKFLPPYAKADCARMVQGLRQIVH